MKRNLMKIVCSFLLLLTCAAGFSQKKLYPYRVRDKFGYSDEKKKIVIEPQFYQAYPFYEGLALVKITDAANKIYCGFINEKGKWVIPASFSYASDFQDGKSIVRARTGYGVIDKKGKIVIDTLNYSIYYNPKEKLYKVEGSGRSYCFFDTDGKQLFPFNFTWLSDASDGIAPARNSQNQYGYINMKGEWVLGPKKEYISTRPFSDGIGSVTLSSTPAKGNDIYINIKGEQVIPGYFSNAGPFKNGIASVDYSGYINKKGEKLLTKYNSTGEFRGGLALVRNTDVATRDTYYLIDTDGNELASTSYTGGGFYFGEEGPVLKQNFGKYGVIDRKGKTIIECKYDKLSISRSGLFYTYVQDQNYNSIVKGYISEKGIEYWED